MRNWGIIAALAVVLAGCGGNDKDRAVSGGGIGAGLGTAAGVLIGGPIGGFVLGGAVGAATGLVTDEEAIDLGDPIWARNENAQETAASSVPNGTADQTTSTVPANREADANAYDTEFRILN